MLEVKKVQYIFVIGYKNLNLLNLKDNKESSHLTKGVFRFKCSIPSNLEFVCIYLLKYDGINILIDAGLNLTSCSKKFISLIKEQANISLDDIDYCIVTHAHPDHVGLIGKFKKKNPDMKLIMHEITCETLKWMTDLENFEEIEKKAWDLSHEMIRFGVPESIGKNLFHYFLKLPNLIKFHEPDIMMAHSDNLPLDSTELQLIWAPGHDLGHICLHDKKSKVLFSGDHILSESIPHINILTMTPQFSSNYDFSNILDLYLKSLEKIDKFDLKMIFPSHQEIIYNPGERILEIKRHHEERLASILEMIEDDPKTPYDICQILYGNFLDEMNSYMSLNEVLVHLMYLEGKGKVERNEIDEKIMFFS